MLEKIRFNRKAGIWYLILVSVVIAVPLFWLAWVYLPLQIFEYQLSHIKDTFQRGMYSRYYDLDGDGIGEEVAIQNYRTGYYVLEIYKYNGDFVKTIDLYGNRMPVHRHTVVGDYNSDGSSDIFYITLSEDSIFLSGFNPFSEYDELFSPILLDVANLAKNKFDISVFGFKMIDVDRDGYKDLFITIQAGYSLYPRKIYVYDIHRKVLKRSKSLGFAPTHMHLIDSDEDGKLEFFGTTNAIKNHSIDTPILFNDNSAWFFGLDDDLKTFLFKPIEFKMGKPFADSFLLDSDTAKHIGIFLHDYDNVDDQFLLKYDLTGVRIDSVKLSSGHYQRVYNERMNSTDKILLHSNNYSIDIHNSDFLLEKKLKIANQAISRYDDPLGVLGLFVFIEPGRNLLLCDSDFEIEAKLPLSKLENFKYAAHSIISQTDRSIELVFYSADGRAHYYYLKRNSIYLFRSIIYTLYFLFLSSMLFVVLGVPLFFMISRSRIEKRMHRYHIQAIQNQLEPHFTFNILSSIGSLIYSEKKEQAYTTLTKFADLLRTVLVQGKEGDWSLKKEMDFVNIFLELQNSRFDNKIIIQQSIELSNLNSFKVPKMIVQSYVGNAIKHGLAPKSENCILQIVLKESEQHIILIVEDNGIGRDRAKEISIGNTGQGMHIWSDFFKSYNRLNRVKFQFKIVDLVNKPDESNGTRVTIKIPLDYDNSR